MLAVEPRSFVGQVGLVGRVGRVRRLLTAGVLAVVISVPATAREFRYGDIVVRALPDLPQSTTHGYHEFPFQVINESAVSRRVTLSGPDAAHAGAGLHSLRTIERSITVGPRSSVRLALWQPPLPTFGSGLRVSVDGRPQREIIPWSSGHPEYWIGAIGHRSGSRPAHRSRRILISPRLSEDGFPPHPQEEYIVFRAVMPMAAWSGDWRAYSGYDGVVTTAEELRSTPAAVADALWRYVETGGSMLILGWPEDLEPAGFWGRERRRRSLASVYESGLTVDYAGFGVVLTAEGAAQVDDFTEPQLTRLEDAWRRSRKMWDVTRDPSKAHQRFAVADRVEIPVRGLFLVVLAFTVLIGPVNLALLTFKGKRIWLLWTVPAASLLTCAVVVLYVLAGEGLVRFARTEGLTVLDQRARRATTVGWTGYYATLTPGQGLSFDAGTEVSPVVSWARDQRGDDARVVRWSDRQHLARGWLRARLPSYFIVRKNEPRRERINLRRRDDGSLEAVNGLGVDLESLSVADADGRIHQAEGLRAGAAGPLAPTDERAAGDPGVLRALYRGDLPTRLPRIEQEPEAYLRPGTWVAVARASPFIETALDGLDRQTSKSVIYGFAGEGP